VKRVQGLVNRLYVRSLRGSGDIGSWYVHRHRLAMPQYAVGHLERVAAIEARAAWGAGLRARGRGGGGPPARLISPFDKHVDSS